LMLIIFEKGKRLTWSEEKPEYGIGCFWDQLPFYSLVGLDCKPPICASCLAGYDRHASLHLANDWDRISLTFWLGWLRTMILSISASKLAWIAVLRHHAWP
jgi:hypothetical protein